MYVPTFLLKLRQIHKKIQSMLEAVNQVEAQKDVC